VDNIKMDLREIGWDDMDWINLAQDRDQWRALENMVMNPRKELEHPLTLKMETISIRNGDNDLSDYTASHLRKKKTVF
jgi:hypothetical protein